MPLLGGAAASGFAAAQRPNEDAAAHDLLQRGEIFHGAAAAIEKVAHILTVL